MNILLKSHTTIYSVYSYERNNFGSFPGWQIFRWILSASQKYLPEISDLPNEVILVRKLLVAFSLEALPW